MERFRTSSPLTSTPRRGIPRSTRRSPHRLSPASSRSSPAIPSTSHQIPTQSPIDRSRSPEALRKSPFLSPQDHFRRTVSPETSPKYLRIPSPGTPLQYSLASSLGGSTQSPGSPIEYPGSPIESPGGPIESPGSPIESPVARTPSPRPRARRRLYKTPSPVRPELITPSPKTPPWETAFRRALYPTPPQPPTPPSPDTPSPARPTASPIHPIRGLPFTSRQTISPERSRESLYEFGSDFVRLKRVPRIPLEQRQGTPPDQKYHYASPGVTPQIIVSEDSSIEDENIPPEFRGLVPAYETEKLFCPRELEGKPEHEELLSLMKKFYEGDYENIKEAIRELAKKYIPQMRGEKNTIMILKALENYIEGLLVTIHTHDQSGRSELLKMAQERMNELRSDFMEEKNNFNRYIEMLESKLMEEARDNRRLVGKEIELESQLRSLQEKMAQPLVVEREEYEKYEQELELDELRARVPALEAENRTLIQNYDRKRVKYKRLLNYILEAHKILYDVCDFKHRKFYPQSTDPPLSGIELRLARYDNPNYGLPSTQSSPALTVKEAMKEMALMAQAFTQGQVAPSEEVAQRAVEQWHDLILEEIERDKKYLTEFAYEKVGYTEAVLKCLQERDAIVKLDLEMIPKIEKAEKDLRLKKEKNDEQMKAIKRVEANLRYASEYYRDIKNLWENCKYKYLSAVRRQGLRMYWDGDRWLPAFPSPSQPERVQILTPQEYAMRHILRTIDDEPVSMG